MHHLASGQGSCIACPLQCSLLPDNRLPKITLGAHVPPANCASFLYSPILIRNYYNLFADPLPIHSTAHYLLARLPTCSSSSLPCCCHAIPFTCYDPSFSQPLFSNHCFRWLAILLSHIVLRFVRRMHGQLCGQYPCSTLLFGGGA